MHALATSLAMTARSLGVGLVLYFWYRGKQKLPAAGRLEIEKLSVPGHKEVTVKKELVPILNPASNEMVQFAARMAKDYGASMSAMHVIEIPPSLPLDTFFPEKLAVADTMMEQAQAIAREFEVPVEAQIKQARFAGESIVEVAREGGFDLVILGARLRPLSTAPGRTSFGTTIEYVVKNAHCRVWLFTGKS